MRRRVFGRRYNNFNPTVLGQKFDLFSSCIVVVTFIYNGEMKGNFIQKVINYLYKNLFKDIYSVNNAFMDTAYFYRPLGG